MYDDELALEIGRHVMRRGRRCSCGERLAVGSYFPAHVAGAIRSSMRSGVVLPSDVGMERGASVTGWVVPF